MGERRTERTFEWRNRSGREEGTFTVEETKGTLGRTLLLATALLGADLGSAHFGGWKPVSQRVAEKAVDVVGDVGEKIGERLPERSERAEPLPRTSSPAARSTEPFQPPATRAADLRGRPAMSAGGVVERVHESGRRLIIRQVGEREVTKPANFDAYELLPDVSFPVRAPDGFLENQNAEVTAWLEFAIGDDVFASPGGSSTVEELRSNHRISDDDEVYFPALKSVTITPESGNVLRPNLAETPYTLMVQFGNESPTAVRVVPPSR